MRTCWITGSEPIPIQDQAGSPSPISPSVRITSSKVDDNDQVVGGLLHEWKHVCEGALIEDKANGSAVVNTIRQHVSGAIPVNPEGGKQSRASSIVMAVRSGHVLLPDGAPWLEDFVSEFSDFPAGKWNDQVDALSQGIVYRVDNEDTLRARWMSEL